MNTDAIITVDLRFPHPRSKLLSVAFPVQEHVFDRSLAPLSRYHDAPLEFKERAHAFEQKEMRSRVVQHMAAQIAEKLMQLCEQEDPKMGYSPQEWEAMHSERP